MTTTTRLRRIRRDRGSIPMALLVVIVGTGLVALMLPMVVMQISSSSFASSRSEALHAAQSGIEMGIAEIRSATTEGEGDRRKLPCGPLTGPATDDGSTYHLDIEYFYAGDPSLHDDDWRKDHVMICATGAGPYDSASGSGTPSFALLTATGSSPNEVRERTLEVTYIVKTTNRNIAGGAIPLFPKAGSTNHFCLDAGIPIKANNRVGALPCPTDPSRIPVQQKWAYTEDLTLQLTATVGDLNLNPDGTGLCLDTVSSPHAVGTLMTVRPCARVTDGKGGERAVWRQVWSINGSGHFEGSKSDYSDLDSYCLYAVDQPAVQLSLNQKCGTSTTDPQGAWNPMPSVGAGQAGAANGQLVNFAQFGRCLDVTNQSTGSGDNGGTFLILYPCKQNPNITKLAWNQKWEAVPVGTDTVQWRTYVNNKTSNAYCLTSPLSTTGYVHVKACGTTTGQVWTKPTDVDSAGNQLAYAKKYVTRDQAGLCLSASPDEYFGNAKVAVAACAGATDQKWNADPNVTLTSVIRLHELAPAGK